MARAAGRPLDVAPSPGAGVVHLAAASIARLDAYVTEVLGCSAALARGGGVHLVVSRRRALPAWFGYVIPVLAVSYAEGAVVTVRPDLAEALRERLGSDLARSALDLAAVRRLGRAARQVARHAYVLAGDMRAVDEHRFRPSPTERRAELIPPDDPAAAHLRARFDGAIFGVRGPRNALVSWAALKLKSPTVWEVAVATEPDYRGRGYARDVVSAATRHTLEQGRLCLYIHDHDNRTSAFVCRSLGYQRYAEVVLAEY